MRISLIIALILFLSNLKGQNCDYDFEMGTVVYFPKDLNQTLDQKKLTLKKVKKLKKCLKNTNESIEQYWFFSSIASNSYIISEIDSTLNYAILAFSLDSTSFCKEYVDLHISSLEEDFPFKKHYMDNLDSEELSKIASYCKSHYLEDKMKVVENQKIERKKELESEHLNNDYIKELNKIGLNDQQERKNKQLDWTIQNRLDSLNRNRLDHLFELYGFPSKEIVTKEGATKAFMVLHHSTDCKWNEKWTIRFLDHYEKSNLENLFSFYFYRNFNIKDGGCNDNLKFLNELKESLDSTKIDKLLNFTKWEKIFNEK